MTTSEIALNICINIKARVTNDSIGFQKEIDAKVMVMQWISQELNIPVGCELDISHGSGEVEVFDLESITAEVI